MATLNRKFPVYRHKNVLNFSYTALIPLNSEWEKNDERDFFPHIAEGTWNIEDIISFVLKYKAEYPWLVDLKWNVWNMDHYGILCPVRKRYFIYSEDMK